MDEFEFDLSGLSPFSDLLDRVLFRLETSAVLGTLNPAYSRYEIRDETKEYIRAESQQKFSGELLSVIQAVGGRFEQLVRILC